jgi:hypothetical protein
MHSFQADQKKLLYVERQDEGSGEEERSGGWHVKEPVEDGQ